MIDEVVQHRPVQSLIAKGFSFSGARQCGSVADVLIAQRCRNSGLRTERTVVVGTLSRW